MRRVMQTASKSVGQMARSISLEFLARELNRDDRAFDEVTWNIKLSCGAIPLDKFIVNDFEEDGPYYNEYNAGSESESRATSSKPKAEVSPNPSLATLFKTCERISGNFQALNYEIVDEGPQNIGCILTVRGFNGTVRSYKTEPSFNKRIDAKEEAARMAIQMGVLDFIKTGATELERTKRVEHLSRVPISDAKEGDHKAKQSEPPGSQVDPSVASIDACCDEWRAGKVKAEWVSYRDPKRSALFGAALRIALTPHALRIYSTGAIFSDFETAQVACATVALDEDVLDYIKYGNGQKRPEKVVEYPGEQGTIRRQSSSLKPQVSLQEFFETLPKPFPEPLGDKTASEVLAPNWVNSKVASAKVHQLRASFYWTSSNARGGSFGCLLRIERLNRAKAYLVDPLFSRRADAKAAVCLLAMSQGLGEYIRSLTLEVENMLSQEHRILAAQKIIPTLISRCQKLRPGNRPKFESISENSGHGCILKVDVSASEQHPDIREYSVKAEYRAKADAKLAVACVAAKSGIMDILRFYGGPIPEGQTPYWEILTNSARSNKRKETQPLEHATKKRKTDSHMPGTPESVEQGEIVEDKGNSGVASTSGIVKELATASVKALPSYVHGNSGMVVDKNDSPTVSKISKRKRGRKLKVQPPLIIEQSHGRYSATTQNPPLRPFSHPPLPMINPSSQHYAPPHNGQHHRVPPDHRSDTYHLPAPLPPTYPPYYPKPTSSTTPYKPYSRSHPPPGADMSGHSRRHRP